MNGWDAVDKQFADKISLTTEFEQLLSFFIQKYIKHKLPDFVLNTEDHRYSMKSANIICQITDSLKNAMKNNDNITKEWFYQHFQENLAVSMFKEI